MPIPTLTQPASYGSSETAQPNLRTIVFADGYAQVAPVGLNHNPYQSEVLFANLTNDLKTALLDFLAARGGYEMFYWTPPHRDTPITCRCETWGVTYEEYDNSTVTASIKQVFDPV